MNDETKGHILHSLLKDSSSRCLFKSRIILSSFEALELISLLDLSVSQLHCFHFVLNNL